MRTLNRVLMALMALVILVGGVGFSAQPAQAQGCAYWHYVRYGETLYWIGRMYNMPWTAIAAANGIGNPRWIYAGTSLCIPFGGPNPGPWQPGGQGGAPAGYRLWSFSVATVQPGTKVGINGFNLPSNIRINVMMGVPSGNNKYDFTNLGDLDTDSGNNKYYELPLTNEPFKSAPTIKLRFTQTKQNGKVFQQDLVFRNTVVGGQPVNQPVNWNPWGPGMWWGVPTIWISSVARDNQITFVTNNYPANLDFQVFMGPMGSTGIGGIPVGSFNSGAGGSFSVTVPIPPALYGQFQIAVRTQSTWGGFYSYNWFYNNSTY